MVIAPDSDIYLLKTPFEIDNINQLTFTSAMEQFNYFNSLPKLLMENATYQRKDNVVRYSGLFDDLIGYNYCMYRNNNFSDKWFYAYIKNINFVNPNMTELELETDVFQSYQFDIVYKRMFVEREHVNNDTIGLHTIPEGLEHGEYIVNSLEYDNYNISSSQDHEKICYILSSSLDLSESHPSGEGKFSFRYGRTYAGTYSGLLYWASQVKYGTGVSQKLLEVNGCGQIDAIVGCFVAPKWVVGTYGESDTDTSGLVHQSVEPASVNITINKNSTLGSSKFGTYTPRNNKLWTGDYNYLLVNNGAGGTAKFNWEDFTNNQAQFKMTGVLTPGCSIKLVPNNLYYSGYNDTASIMLGKYPELSFSGDMYLNWLTQTAVNSMWDIGLGVANSVVNTSIGGLTGTGVDLGTGFSSIHEYMQQKRMSEFNPPQNKGNINSGDVSYANGFTRFQFYKMTIKPEYARIIDNFFDMYGYQVNDVKIPNITGRRNWNYVKTSNCNILGDIPQQDIQKLKSMFDKGITFWHNPNTFLDYSQNNNIV